MPANSWRGSTMMIPAAATAGSIAGTTAIMVTAKNEKRKKKLKQNSPESYGM